MVQKGYIYKITSPSDKIYIGQTINPKRRRYEYKCNNKISQKIINRSISKYGWENHKFEIIEELDLNHDILNERETFWIKKFDSFNNGMNLTEGGGSKKVSEETKKKCSENTLTKLSIIIDNIEYESIQMASLKLNIHRETIRRRLSSKGFPNYIYLKYPKNFKEKPAKGTHKKKRIIINGTEYESVTMASYLLKIKLTTIYGRLHSSNFQNYEIIS